MDVEPPSDEDIDDALTRFGLLAAVMPDGYAVADTAGELAAIANALPSDTAIAFDPLLRAVPGWKDLPDPVTVLVARLGWLVQPDPDAPGTMTSEYSPTARWTPTVQFGRRILTHEDGSAADATVLALPEDRASEALDSGRLDVFLTQVSRVLTRWADTLAGEASDGVLEWLKSLSYANSDQDGPGHLAWLDADAARLRESLWAHAHQLRQTALALQALARPPGGTTP
jgi:hypothetical protein